MATVLVIAMVSAASVGCGGGGSKSSSDKQSTKTAPDAVSTATSPSGKPREAPLRALAGGESTVDGDGVRLDIVSLKRSGETTALTIRLTLVDGTDQSASAQVAQTFDDGENQKLASNKSSVANLDTMDGFSLIDTKNRKRYLVGRDTEGACACDTDLGSAFVKPDSPLLLSATFGAPPPEVKAVDLQIPRFGTFKDVPIS